MFRRRPVNFPLCCGKLIALGGNPTGHRLVGCIDGIFRAVVVGKSDRSALGLIYLQASNRGNGMFEESNGFAIDLAVSFEAAVKDSSTLIVKHSRIHAPFECCE